MRYLDALLARFSEEQQRIINGIVVVLSRPESENEMMRDAFDVCAGYVVDLHEVAPKECEVVVSGDD